MNLITDLVNHIFVETGRRWKIGGAMLTPTEKDIEQALDAAAKMLYDEEVGSSLSVGGLIIEKTDNGFDAYVHVGEFR